MKQNEFVATALSRAYVCAFNRLAGQQHHFEIFNKFTLQPLRAQLTGLVNKLANQYANCSTTN